MSRTSTRHGAHHVGATVSSRLACRIVEALERHGLDADDVCRRAGIARSDLRDVEARVDESAFMALWEVAARDVATPGFSLEVACASGDVHNLLRFVCLTAPNLGAAFDCACRYIPLLTDLLSLDLVPRGDAVHLRFERRDDTSAVGARDSTAQRLAEEFVIGETVVLARRATGLADWAPLEVRFERSAPQHDDYLRAFVRCPITYAAESTEIVLAGATLSLPLSTSDPSGSLFFQKFADRLLDRPDVTVRGTVEQVLRERLESAPSITDIARRLAMSERTLRRRLADEGTTYQRVLDETRRSVAKQLVAEREPLGAIASRLGFSDVTAFHRAFRRWTGTTPQAFHRAAPPRVVAGREPFRQSALSEMPNLTAQRSSICVL